MPSNRYSLEEILSEFGVWLDVTAGWRDQIEIICIFFKKYKYRNVV